MVREELYITVPNLFRCPISMDVMRSPVSLSTGVTYDRSSIQHWLDSGHDTCPATMQTLPSKDFVPNLTLRRLINLWAQSHGPPSPSSSSSSVTVSEEQLKYVIDELKGKNEGENSKLIGNLSSIADFAGFSDENRRSLADFDGFVSAIVGVLSRGGAKMEILELIIRILDSILLDNRGREQAHGLISKRIQAFLTSIRLVLRNASLKSKIESARVLRSIANDEQSKRAISDNRDLVLELLNLLTSESDYDQALHDAVYSCLIAISATRSTKAQLVGLGIVNLLARTLSDRNTNKSVAEKAMKLLSIVSTCAEGRSAISEDRRCAEAAVERLMKVSTAATEDAVAVLWSVCCLLGEKKTKESVVRSNGVAKILLVMQSGYCEGHPVRRMCGDLLRVLKIGCSSDGFGLGSYQSKTTHILPC